MPIKAIVFDMDDTLYRERDYLLSGCKAVGRWLQENYQISGFSRTAVNILNSGETKYIFNKTLEFLNISYDEQLIKELIDRYRSHEPDIHMLEDAEWIVDHLSASVKIGLISDGYLVSQAKKVKALNLKQKFHSIILSDRYGRDHWKPSPIPYQELCKELQLRHEQCVYIGDNVKKDFITAKRLGWTTVHIDRKDGIYSGVNLPTDYHAHYKVSDLRQLLHIPAFKCLFELSNNKVVVK